jgi:endogenous inhibitor of DNA gyrase (YacG/DUF329 family)
MSYDFLDDEEMQQEFFTVICPSCGKKFLEPGISPPFSKLYVLCVECYTDHRKWAIDHAQTTMYHNVVENLREWARENKLSARNQEKFSNVHAMEDFLCTLQHKIVGLINDYTYEGC